MPRRLPRPRLSLGGGECQIFSPAPLEGGRSAAYVAARSATVLLRGPPASLSFDGFEILWRTEMKFRPLHDRVVVRRLDAEEKTAGGIIIPDTAKEKPQQGEVIAVGPGARDESGKIQPLDVKVGDRVLFGKWSGTEVRIGGEDLLIMKESDIMGILEDSVARKKAA
jgi:chaperonin GroES